MATDIVSNFDSIQAELERAKNNLKGLNENIRRIVGREPNQETHLRNDRKRTFGDSKRNDYSLDKNRNRDPKSLSPSIKRRLGGFGPPTGETKSVFSRLSGPTNRDDDKPKIFSRVIRELPTRQEIVAAQTGDAESRARNRRMFGSLMGTLQKFCQEESRLKQKEEKKAQIERKLEEQQIRERINMKKERQNLFTNRKKQQMQIRMLEVKMTRLKELAIWEAAKKPIGNFIRTKTKPHIYYLPKLMDENTEKKLADSAETLKKEIETKQQVVNEELLAIENRYRTSSESPKRPDDNSIQQLHSPKRDSDDTKHDRHNKTMPTEDSPYRSDDDEDMDRDDTMGDSDYDPLNRRSFIGVSVKQEKLEDEKNAKAMTTELNIKITNDPVIENVVEQSDDVNDLLMDVQTKQEKLDAEDTNLKIQMEQNLSEIALPEKPIPAE